MATTNISAYGIYRDSQAVADAVAAMRESGFRSTDISVLYSDNLGSKDFAHEKHSKAPEGAVAGGGTGAVAGAAFGWVLGAGSLLVPGLEPFVTAGPVMGMLGGMGAGVALGGLTGAMVGAGIPEYEAKRYTGKLRKGGILVSVHCDNSRWAKTARELLKRTGATHISTKSEARADFARSEKPLPRTRPYSDSPLQHH